MNASTPANGMLREGTKFPSPFTRLVALGYYDGPTQGILECGAAGDTYKFDLIDGDDLRLYSLAPLPKGSFDEVVRLLTPYQQPRWPAWCPLWSFPSDSVRQEVEKETDRILSGAGPGEWVVAAEDVLGEIVSARKMPVGQSGQSLDWFSLMKLDRQAQ
jgi:hypothetical protein